MRPEGAIRAIDAVVRLAVFDPPAMEPPSEAVVEWWNDLVSAVPDRTSHPAEWAQRLLSTRGRLQKRADAALALGLGEWLAHFVPKIDAVDQQFASVTVAIEGACHWKGLELEHWWLRRALPADRAIQFSSLESYLAVARSVSTDEVELREARRVLELLEGCVTRADVLAGADLVGVSLLGADLSGLDLTGVDFSHSCLIGADLSGATLDGCVLRRADLRLICGKQASLREADLTEADLRGADFAAAELVTAVLVGANARGTSFRSANLDGSTLDGADVSRAGFSEATLTGTSWTGSHGASGAKGQFAAATDPPASSQSP